MHLFEIRIIQHIRDRFRAFHDQNKSVEDQDGTYLSQQQSHAHRRNTAVETKSHTEQDGKQRDTENDHQA